MQANERIIVALDVDTAERAEELVCLLRGRVGVFKAGLELVISAGAGVFDRLRAAGAERLFYDAKLHDIPNTVAGAMRGVVRRDAWCVTVHTTGGAAMLRAAVDAATTEAKRGQNPRPKVLGVTVLTSIGPDALRDELGVGLPVSDYVVHLARLAQASGCDGVIASPNEIEAVRQAVPDPDFLIVTPGVRPAGSDRGDQARVMTPGEAIKRGASYLVIGRPIVAASNPARAAEQIAAEIDAASSGAEL